MYSKDTFCTTQQTRILNWSTMWLLVRWIPIEHSFPTEFELHYLFMIFQCFILRSRSWNGRSDDCSWTWYKHKCTDYWSRQRLWRTESACIVNICTNRAQHTDSDATAATAWFIRLAASDIGSNERLSRTDKQRQLLADGQRIWWHPTDQQYDIQSG